MSEILGIGIDIVENERIRRSIERHGERFLRRVFTDAEIAYCQESKFPEQRFGARFAAKEAVSKAFGTGIGSEMALSEIEVCRKPSGEPRIRLHGKAGAFARGRNVREVLISLTHTREHSAAQAVIIAGNRD